MRFVSMISLARLAGLFVALLLFPETVSPASAHPHVWVDYTVDVVASPEGITKLKFHWSFDEMFSDMVFSDFKIKKMTPDNVVFLRDHAFANLKNYHYYLFITADGQEFEPQQIADFDAKIKNKILEYYFTVTLPHPAKNVDATLYDSEFYVDIGPPMQKPVANKPGIMEGATSDPKPFITSSAEGGAQPPLCAYKSGETRVSPVWGKFPVYVVSCHAKE